MTTNSLSSVMDRMMTLRNAMDNAFGAESGGGSPSSRRQFWMPPVDVYETEAAFVVEADLPGVHPENVEISFEQNTLTFKGNRGPTVQAPERGELRAYTLERTAGAFGRSIRLPEYVEGDRIEAAYNNGVLTVTVPKAKAALPRKITIKATSNEGAKSLNA